MELKEIEALLRAHGIKPSPYRMRAYQYLAENRNHPSIDLMYREISAEMPTLSKTTLYNTMQLFLEKGLVMLITINANELHYDADTSPHGHFRCIQCGKIYDTEIDAHSLKFQGMEDFEVHDCHLYFWGLCPACLAKGPNI